MVLQVRQCLYLRPVLEVQNVQIAISHGCITRPVRTIACSGGMARPVDHLPAPADRMLHSVSSTYLGVCLAGFFQCAVFVHLERTV